MKVDKLDDVDRTVVGELFGPFQQAVILEGSWYLLFATREEADVALRRHRTECHGREIEVNLSAIFPAVGGITASSGEASASAQDQPPRMRAPSFCTPAYEIGVLAIGERIEAHPHVNGTPAMSSGRGPFTADRLPSGMDLDPKTGVISGSLAALGTHILSVTVCNRAGEDARQVILRCERVLGKYAASFLGKQTTQALEKSLPESLPRLRALGWKQHIEATLAGQPEWRESLISATEALRKGQFSFCRRRDKQTPETYDGTIFEDLSMGAADGCYTAVGSLLQALACLSTARSVQRSSEKERQEEMSALFDEAAIRLEDYRRLLETSQSSPDWDCLLLLAQSRLVSVEYRRVEQHDCSQVRPVEGELVEGTELAGLGRERSRLGRNNKDGKVEVVYEGPAEAVLAQQLMHAFALCDREHGQANMWMDASMRNDTIESHRWDDSSILAGPEVPHTIPSRESVSQTRGSAGSGLLESGAKLSWEALLDCGCVSSRARDCMGKLLNDMVGLESVKAQV